MSYPGRIDGRGKPVVNIGKRYRNIPSSTTCTLCRQLHSPWIEPFLKTLDPSQWKGKYFGDRIQIFRHLRHLTHVSDYQTSMNVLRINNAPYHIAVVPFGGEWRDSLQSHIALHGMVVIIPEGGPQSEIFVPQQVSRKFDRRVARQWLNFCARHQKLCNPKAPNVTGMKVIDCDSKDRIIRAHNPIDKYVALSYVWGSAAPSTTLATPSTGSEALQIEQRRGDKVEDPQLVRAISQYIKKSTPIRETKTSVSHQSSATEVRMDENPKLLSKSESILRLPKTIPLTIQDAMKVTKDLGYRFLWVDRYCIDQSSEFEKQQQCSRMGDIYAGSQVTLFALGPDSEYGLPGVSSRLRNWQRQITTVGKYRFISTMSDPHISISQSKWSTRGWTYQEGLFSSRRLFFTDHQAYFECNAMNCVETFKSNLKILHIQSGQRFRAYHRAGKFVCGNSNKYSHLNIKGNTANHRKIDTIRRCQYHIQEYTKRELTNKDDILNAFAGIARFYARSNAKIISLAGLPIPLPIASREVEREHLDHLSYALAWTHRVHRFSEPKTRNPYHYSDATLLKSSWSPGDNPEPRRRLGFPSWSWAGWYGEVELREDLPYCWTSHLSSVRIGFRKDNPQSYAWLTKFSQYRHILIQKLLTAVELRFEAFVLNPESLKSWERGPRLVSRRIPSKTLKVNLSKGPSSLEKFHQKLIDGELECLVIGTYGEPRENIFKAIQDADKKAPKARKGRIGLFERLEPDAIICLVVHTVNKTSFRRGILRIEIKDAERERALQVWNMGPKRAFILR